MNIVTDSHDLTPAQRVYLKMLWDFCRKKPSLAQTYRKVLPRYVILALLAVLPIYCLVSFEEYEAAWLVGGIAIGFFLREYFLFQHAIHVLPATIAILDRKKIAELLQEHVDDFEPNEWS